ncbi:oxidoreductase [Pseudarthrobacter sp. CC12]|uniref:ferredoxin--NADP reductase n=1 Tax=unclassified Pseudarthrobacter TaxID=2647000 RepID=UPI00113015A7|nr:FAD-dependent oxidoreductase [Pseudarthrobacter sp. NIBRBAC000502771]QDG63070.1 oxidoreductase [Pseudarthrobacter sp. NIBRBAC000502771]
MSSVDTPQTGPVPSLSGRIGSAVGRFTMYRLILLVLAALAAYSLLLDVLGWLTFGIPEMLGHLALCLGLTWATNRALAALFRVNPHTESSLITGLLLYFLFWPSLQPMDLAGVALACVLASASKYALAWRGRHIFNPAAAGAFATGLTGLNVATWWAATPAMLWLLVPGVLLVLHRTRKLLMAAVFTIVATAIINVELLRSGMTAGMGLWQALAQRPVLFFVGFMLTEPLTLPPRRRQQLVLAGVVGVLFALPWNLGPVANSPEAALLAGNLLAFLSGQRGAVKLRFAGNRPLTPTTAEFSFEAARPVRFLPGQYMELDLPHARPDGKGRRRVFSLTGSPGGRLVSFGVRTAGPVSAAKEALLALRPGDPVTATAVGGDFVLPRDPRRPVLLIAAGIGITPFVSQLSSGALRERDAILLLLARSADEVPYTDELRSSGLPVMVMLADGSRPPSGLASASPGARGEPGAPGRLDGKALAALVPDIARREVYVSGSPASVASLRRAARRAGARRVRTDSFAGY